MIYKLDTIRRRCTGCEFYGDDPLKLLVKVPSLTGYQLSEMLYEDFGIEDEITNSKSTMLLCGIGTDNKKLDKLYNILSKL